MVLIIAQGSWEETVPSGHSLRMHRREGNSIEYSTVLITALGSWEKTVHRAI
jgi:hypothetical protein